MAPRLKSVSGASDIALVLTIAVTLCVAIPLAIYLSTVSSRFARETRIVRPDGTYTLNEVLVYVITWILLAIISVAATLHVRKILIDSAANEHRRRANDIGIVIGLVLIVMLFKQPFLDRLFGQTSAGAILQTLLFGGGVAAGWIIWYLQELKKYGEFFEVLLYTLVVGCCWYARLTPSDEVQLTAVAFLLGSLFRVARDLMDRANQGSMATHAA